MYKLANCCDTACCDVSGDNFVPWLISINHALYLVEGGLEIQLLTYDRVLLNDGERLEVLNAINDFRSKVIPTAADMLAVVRKVFLFSQLDV